MKGFQQRSKGNILSGSGRASRPMLMGPQTGSCVGKKCLALDLDETLVHSSFQPVKAADYIIPVLIEGTTHNVYVLKRPGVDEFIKRVAEIYEVVVYTASLGKYADPLLDKLDTEHVISKRLFREDCVYHEGHYVKDLSLLNRDIKSCIIVDNSPMSYIFHPDHAIDCSSFIDSKLDRELWQIADFLEAIHAVDDVRDVCRTWREWCNTNSSPSNSPTS
jgi:RNA polymerase II subunit A small phosphatase-like protein